MGRYKREKPRVRKVNGLTIIVRDRETLYVFDKPSNVHVTFHRWWQPLGSYERWSNFRRRVLLNKSLTIDDCFRIAHRWGIKYQISWQTVIIDGEKYDYNSKEEK